MILRADTAGLAVGEKMLLEPLDLALEAGSLLAVIGPNGAGKSSLMKLLAGEQGDRARVYLLKRPLERWPASQLASRRAVLDQQVELAWDYPVGEVVGFGCWWLQGSDRRRVLDAVRGEWQLDDLWERPCRSLSGGEQRRVHLARCAAQLWPRLERAEPALLLLDEPLAHLDPAGETWAMERVRELQGRGAAVVCVLHDMNLALRYADRLLALRDGRLQAEGPVDEVLDADLLERLYDVPFQALEHGDGLPWFVPERGAFTVRSPVLQ